MIAPKKEELPEWFIEKYESFIDFSGDHWNSFSEYKLYGVFGDLNRDVQKVLQEIEGDDSHSLPTQLVYFADEGHICGTYNPDIIHVSIRPKEIIETRMVPREMDS